MSSVLRTAAAAGLAASALTLALPLPAASAAPGAGSPGRATAVTAELALDVRLLDQVDVPVDVSLNRVQSPAQQNGSVLTAKVDGVDQGRPVTLLKADLGRSATSADEHGAAASVRLVDADLHAPGLPGTALLGLEALSAEVTCPVDGPPTAKVVAPAKVTVLGKSVTAGLNGPSHVEVPGVGVVDIQFSRKTTTSSTAAASALEATVDVNPLNLNVARVSGRITIASVSCEKPVPAPASSAAPVPSASPATTAARPVPAPDRSESLASTGSSGTLPVLAGGATLLVTGTAALWMTRRRRAHARRH
ncbi:SCO1860 family LAETG-anchored protein [Kitasatospora sp. MBT63]|uniref:SCO1860 family LAETG-anchored protein n=1 Tax=Kitasatospora sp. MBT63 TaxID=1444768 RepID=UPI00053A3025|nr:SCO1860 family LAETG-anchored protein [Kitasatospora sp. MBT63]